MCGKRLTFLYTSPYEHVQYSVPRFSTFVFEKSLVKSLRGFGWNNVGPTSQTVAQHYFSIGVMYRVIRVVAFRGDKMSPVWQLEQTKICFNVGPASNTIDRH